jgi:hypothetical protein
MKLSTSRSAAFAVILAGSLSGLSCGDSHTSPPDATTGCCWPSETVGVINPPACATPGAGNLPQCCTPNGGNTANQTPACSSPQICTSEGICMTPAPTPVASGAPPP